MIKIYKIRIFPTREQEELIYKHINCCRFIWNWALETQIKYYEKCEEKGIEFIRVDRFYPSSKTCSSCGCIKPNLKLSDRIFICGHCDNIIDRDYNAAINLMQYTC